MRSRPAGDWDYGLTQLRDFSVPPIRLLREMPGLNERKTLQHTSTDSRRTRRVVNSKRRLTPRLYPSTNTRETPVISPGGSNVWLTLNADWPRDCIRLPTLVILQ
ncbi:hypothetical protein RRG08_002811 [Elysia crispata]|uniref:Uncharacterized protein n=1 Tax=Elysia crispata TaxID=231223 RepID=A0AAE1CM38_9GAST|nr:hypothetical protein RRG08_002811 [Elysia crispata]